jgi:hypothetical protein
MFARLTISSISRTSTSGGKGCGLAVAIDAPAPALWLPAAALGVGMMHLSIIVCIYCHHRQTGLLRYPTFGPSPAWCCRLLRPLLTSAAPSRRLATPVAHPLPGAGRQTSQGQSRDLRAIYLSHLRPHPPGDIGLWEIWLPRPDADASYALAVRQAGTLLTASFRPRLATTPLLFG